MASEDGWIFYKNEKNEINGPYTEDEVLRRYREERLQGSFRIYHMTGDERRPNDDTGDELWDTLDDLIKRKGSINPFARGLTPMDYAYMHELHERMLAIIKEIRAKRSPTLTPTSSSSAEDLSPTSSSSDAATAAPAVTNAAPAATAAKKSEEEISEDAKLAKAWAAYYIDVLEAYKTDKWDKVGGEKAQDMVASMEQVYSSDSLCKKSQEVLTEKLKALTNSRYVYCSECDSIFLNYKQILLHVVAKEHIDNVSDELHKLQKIVNNIMLVIFCEQIKSWFEEEHDMRQKHRALDASDSKLRPSENFVTRFKTDYVKVNDSKGKNAKFSPAQIVDKMFRRLQNDAALGNSMLKQVHDHLKGQQTRCTVCNMATGGRQQYYEHLKTFSHLSKAEGKDLITFVVNMYKND